MKKRLIQGTVILTAAGLFGKLLGFFYRIFLSHTIGAEGMGLYQLIFPVFNLCFAFSVAGIQTALSRMIAASLAKKDVISSRAIFLTGLCCSVSAAVVLSLLLRHFSGFISSEILNEPRCGSLLKMLSLGLPLSTIHACITGYFFAKKETAVPAALQVAEQLVRFGSSYIIYIFFLKNQISISPMIAVAGLVCSEFVSMALSLLFVLHSFHMGPAVAVPFLSCKKHLPEILRLSFPITLNRVLLNLLHSIEAILIPWSLQRSWMSSSEALSTFGILNGMALPLILFPTAIINSMAAVLLPTVAEEQALKNHHAIWVLIRNTSACALFMGFLFTFVFFFGGTSIGSLLFDDSQAGIFIRILSFICPFLYINITLSSILHGLGKTFSCFLINLFDLIIRILSILLLIPHLGIWGYLYGLLSGEILAAIASMTTLACFMKKDQS